MRSIRTNLAVLASALMVAAVGFAGLAPAAGATIRLGAFNSGAPANATTLASYAAEVGRQPDIVLWYTDFGGNLLTAEEMSTLKATGQAPMVTWEPHNQSLSAIASGSYDSYLRGVARKTREWPGELMVRFAHEMNGSWYPWSGSPSTYVAAWRHVVTIFREEGAANVKWVWAPNVDRTGAMPFAEYFPGESWVDYIGLDGYNWGNTSPEDHWSSLKEVFSASYAKITSLSQKPLIITETGSSETGGSKAEWIRTGFMQTIPQDFPRITGVIWFNKVDSGNWPIDTSQSSLEAYREVAQCSIYGGTQPCGSTSTTTTEEASVGSVEVTPRVKKKHRRSVRGTVSYRLSRKARVKIEIQRRAPHGFVARASLTRNAHAGRNRVPLRQVTRSHRLPAGSYRVTVTALGGGRHSAPRRDHFRVLTR